MGKFVIFTDSCSDMPTWMRKELGVEYFRMGIVVDGVEKYADLDFKDYTEKEFYDWMRNGSTIKTTQVSSQEFSEKSREWLEKGFDILYISCSSALSGSINTFNALVKPVLEEEFPDRKMVAVDSLAGSMTIGIIVKKAAELQKEGKSMEEVIEWVEANKLRSNQFCTVPTLTYLQKAGRVKVFKAFMGNLIGKKPIVISDKNGMNNVLKTVRGTKVALQECVDGLLDAMIEKPEDVEVWVGHGDDIETANILKEKLESKGVKKIIVGCIGPIVGTTCGPGVVSVFSWGKEVTYPEQK